MLDVFKKMFSLLSERERRRFYVLLVVMIVMSAAEVIGVSTVLVLLNVLADPNMIHKQAPLQWLYQTFGFTSDGNFQFFLTIAVFFAILTSLAIKALGSYAIVRYSAMRGYTLSSRLLEAYLKQPYVWFLERNSSEISKSVLQEVGRLVTSVLIPSLSLLANALMAVSLLTLLLLIEPVIATTAAVIIGGGYALIYLTLRQLLSKYGRDLMDANALRFRLTQEATGGFKEVKLLGMEKHYVDRFVAPAQRIAALTAVVQMFRDLPRFGLEALTFGVMLGAILFLQIRNDGDLTAAIPILGTFAFAVMRLLPAAQNVYHSAASIRNGAPLLDDIFNDYWDAQKRIAETSLGASGGQRLQLQDKLQIRDATFAYPNTDKAALRGLNMIIPAKTTIGIVGGTGAGKTTLVDAILGLLTLERGEIIVDGTVINRDNMQAWRNALGYVPQSIYLTDSTLAENIAFGIDPDKIDMAAVERAAKTAALHSFVINELKDGYHTMVGERGVRLSGGQRQRIGIARALYHDPDVLVFDEATSALDNLTERAVVEAIHNIGHQKTVIMIAHRLSTVRNCDRIFLLEHGKTVASGTFEELVNSNETFRDMASSA
ncbi:ABC-type bacteriocin/lantibiotic exporter, contains an N-terminal double-glycine peptidase domain [Roseovarius litoreus]|uniref:ABC-type bacteriocin/lantibiotic exporter, contains an N-terminal double-glycine peptidase domain n=1 Tax=Roseovarius litoreus TaxID=1155722 RepID=A0A1M7K8Y2_9RHOB|nr:ABC transporter ATP-binding protein [Roseovarius litoreus]SHM61752.1 ABC-type bacteriocin/lantibiotic exporter, contains an N-terminal double-glycine peptidase domain [Roseovarius litoreus]